MYEFSLFFLLEFVTQILIKNIPYAEKTIKYGSIKSNGFWRDSPFFSKMKLFTVTLFAIFLLTFMVILVAPQDDSQSTDDGSSNSSDSSPSGIYKYINNKLILEL